LGDDTSVECPDCLLGSGRWREAQHFQQPVCEDLSARETLGRLVRGWGFVERRLELCRRLGAQQRYATGTHRECVGSFSKRKWPLCFW